jgi:hypothetical protein
MPKITINANARSLAHKTGIDKLGQEKLAKLDRNGDGKVTLTDVRELASKANLDKDGSLSRVDRKAIDKVLGGSTRGTGVSRGGSSESGRTRGGSSESTRGGGGGEAGRVVRGSHNLRGGGGENVVVRPSRGGGGERGGSISWGSNSGGGSWGGGGGE